MPKKSHSDKTYPWTSKLLGSGTMTYYANGMSGAIEATIEFTEIKVDLSNFPKRGEVGFPCKSQGRNFTIKMDLRTINALKTKLALGIPVIIEQRVSFA